MTKKVYINENEKKVGTAIYDILDLDTDILGFRTARIISFRAEDKIKKVLAKKLIDSLKKNKVEYATFRINAKELSIINILEEEGFRIVDGYLSLVKKLGKEEQNDNSPVKIRDATLDDISKLQDDIGPTFIYSRFFNDPFIKKESAVMMHRLWIENCIKGKAAKRVYVAEMNGECAGFIALETNGKEGHIPLIGVNPNYRGKKIAQKLTAYAISHWFAKKNTKFVRIETQLTNIPATRSYENVGFRLVDSKITLRWKSI